MNITTRRSIEERVIRAAVEGLVENGYLVEASDGESTMDATHDVDAVLADLFKSDEEWLYVYTPEGDRVGDVRLSHGSDGWDVIAEHTENLEPALTKASTLADQLQMQFA
jgi:hypothetical protein